MNNGMDRDVAELMLQAFTTADTLVATINDNLFVPHIITQPVNVSGDLGDTITISVVANNVSSYQWQYNSTGSPSNWRNSSYSGNATDTLTFELIEARVGYQFRCKITGKDNSIIYTNVVTVTLNEDDT